jgi:hypothetical protein
MAVAAPAVATAAAGTRTTEPTYAGWGNVVYILRAAQKIMSGSVLFGTNKYFESGKPTAFDTSL